MYSWDVYCYSAVFTVWFYWRRAGICHIGTLIWLKLLLQTTVDQDLEFKLTCSISFGATPSCDGTSRRNLENDKQSEALISYACSMDNDTHVEDGIATKRETVEISSARILSSCTFLAMIFYFL